MRGYSVKFLIANRTITISDVFFCQMMHEHIINFLQNYTFTKFKVSLLFFLILFEKIFKIARKMKRDFIFKLNYFLKLISIYGIMFSIHYVDGKRTPLLVIN